MHDAYDDLPEDTKRKIDGLKAVHVYQSKYSPRSLGKISEESRRNLPPPGIHPLVRTHPENGRKALFLNPVRTESIIGIAHIAPTAAVSSSRRPQGSCAVGRCRGRWCRRRRGRPGPPRP